MRRLFSSASLFAIVMSSAPAFAADPAPADQSAPAAAKSAPSEVSDIIVTGTRQTGMKAADSAAPVQIIGAQSIRQTGSPDLATSLAAVVPSLNVQSNGQDASVAILAALRGLSPNDTLVLVDGKRRHPTSNLATAGGSVYSGSATTDLSFIPVSAIDHIEVLTDGAAAQYGSDAIAGVVNIILKKNAHGGQIDINGGQFYKGDGETASASFNHGFNLNDRGFVSLTLDGRFHDFTVQGIGDSRFTTADGTLRSGLPFPKSNAGKAESFPQLNKVNGNLKYFTANAFVNSAYELTDDVSVYAFGNYGYMESEHYANYRSPDKVLGCTWTLTTCNLSAASPVFGVDYNVLPFPNGFDPKTKFKQRDYSITGGLRGTTGGWNWDLSSTYGGNHTQVYVIDTANAQLFPVLQRLSATAIEPQREFYNGTFDTTQWATNLDVSKEVDLGLAGPLTVAFGGELRRDTYTVGAGEPASYFGAGAQSFAGYSPLDRGNYNRNSQSLYADLAADLVEGLHVDLAGRYEHYSDFGSTTIGKATARYDFSPAFAVRGTISTGFRAPTLAEEHYSGTYVSPFSALVQLPPNSAAAQSAGFAPLKPERSRNYSFGFVAHPAKNLQITVDAYRINLRDRILMSGFLYGSCCTAGSAQTISPGVLAAITAKGATLDSGLSYTGISLFSNAANTRTDGVEVTANYASDFGDFGRVDWTLGFNYTKTKITEYVALPPATANSAAQCASLPVCNTDFLTKNAATALTTANPREKLVLQAFWQRGRWSANIRETVYGPTSQWSPDNSYIQHIGTTGITDLDIGYKISDNFKINVGANNLFDVIPKGTGVSASGAPLGGGLVYNVPYFFAPWNANGGYYYGRLTVTF